MPGEHDLYRISQSGSVGRRLLIGILLLLFVGVIGVTAWMLVRGHDDALKPATESGAGNVADAAQTPPLATPAEPATAATPAQMVNAMADLEQRITRVTVAAQAASGYANRAEAIMVAFAARRAIDAGEPLGYLEDQLRLLFGNAQPKAVLTIINAARDPVTVNKLRAGLEDIEMLAEKSDAKENWWSATMRTLGSLVVIRQAGAPPPEPEQRLARARRDLEAGQVEDAIKELAALPSQQVVAQWLDQARRYNEAHRALDVIEAAAILEPRTTPAVTPLSQAAASDSGAATSIPSPRTAPAAGTAKP